MVCTQKPTPGHAEHDSQQVTQAEHFGTTNSVHTDLGKGPNTVQQELIWAEPQHRTGLAVYLWRQQALQESLAGPVWPLQSLPVLGKSLHARGSTPRTSVAADHMCP